MVKILEKFKVRNSSDKRTFILATKLYVQNHTKLIISLEMSSYNMISCTDI